MQSVLLQSHEFISGRFFSFGQQQSNLAGVLRISKVCSLVRRLVSWAWFQVVWKFEILEPGSEYSGHQRFWTGPVCFRAVEVIMLQLPHTQRQPAAHFFVKDVFGKASGVGSLWTAPFVHVNKTLHITCVFVRCSCVCVWCVCVCDLPHHFGPVQHFREIDATSQFPIVIKFRTHFK